MNKTLCLLSAALLLAGLTGCTSVGKFDYSSAPGTMIRLQEKGWSDKTIAVTPFMDQRSTPRDGAMAELPGDSGSFFWGFLPLFPFAGVEKLEPENSKDFVSQGRFHFDLEHDLSAAAMQSLKASNLFKDVVKANNLTQAKTDYIWRGKVYSTRYSGHYYQYGITYFFAPVLWVLGAPMGDSVNELSVEFELVKRATGKVVWRYNYCNSDYLNHWVYARIGDDTTIYPQLMKQAMNSALKDLYSKWDSLK